MVEFMASEDGSGSSKHRAAQPEIVLGGNNEHVLLILGGNPELDGEVRKSLSSSSDSSSEEDFFQLDATDFSKPMPGTVEAATHDFIFPPVVNDLQLFPLINEDGEPIPHEDPHIVLGEGAQENVDPLDAKQSPPVQEMVRSDVPDPYRIPSSVFAKSNAPTDWSVASNESLFSIHMGNSSFTRDHIILLGKPGDLSGFPPYLPPEHGKDHEAPLTPEQINAETMKDVLRAAADGHAGKQKPPADAIPLYASASHRSNGSTTSINSFAFPILTGDGRSTSVRVVPDRQAHVPKTDGKAEIQSVEGPPNAAQSSWCICLPCSFCR